MKISKELSTGTLPMLVLSVLGSEDLYGYRIIKILEAKPVGVLGIVRLNQYGARILPISKRQNSELIAELGYQPGGPEAFVAAIQQARSRYPLRRPDLPPGPMLPLE